jgi:hypothetical protein
MHRALETAMIAIGASTSTSQVGQFLEVHLQERARARRKSIDNALAAAAQREKNGGLAAPDRTSQRSLVTDTPSSLSLDPPSQTSTATLGSAAVEWPQSGSLPPGGLRRPWLVALGMGSLVGALVIIAAVAMRLVAHKSAAASAPPSEPITLPTAADPAAAAQASPPAVASPAAGAAMAAPTATLDLTLPQAQGRARPPGRPAAAPPPAPAPKPAPAPSAAPPKKRDYGF